MRPSRCAELDFSAHFSDSISNRHNNPVDFSLPEKWVFRKVFKRVNETRLFFLLLLLNDDDEEEYV